MEAFKRQAENASKTAEQFMEECERLKLTNAIAKSEKSKPTDEKMPAAKEVQFSSLFRHKSIQYSNDEYFKIIHHRVL